MGHPAQHINQAVKKQKRVLFVGTASTTYYRGTAVAYNRDYGTAATREPSRDKRVEPFSQSNNTRFAGVLDATVTLPSTGEKWVTINEPGGCADVALGSDVTVDSTLLWAVAGTGGAGRFRSDKGVKVGRGCALALQTNASGNIGESLDGSAAINGTAIAKTGLFADAAAGDKVVILCCVQSDGDADGTPGVYTIASVTDDDNAVLSTSASTAATDCACYVISGNPTALCYLYDGEESGGIEWIETIASAASQSMAGGFTHIMGGVTLDGDATATLADGTAIGERKGFLLHGALTTQDWVLTVTTSPDVATLEFDADADEALLEWRGAKGWHLLELTGAAPVVMPLGSGIKGIAAAAEWIITRTPTVIISQLLLDVVGLNSQTANCIIGDDGEANCHIGQITTAKNGTIFAGSIKCLETPTTGDPDIDFYGSADEATGAENGALTTLTGEEKLLDHGDWTAEEEALLTAFPDADGYMYLVDGGGTNGTYDAGQFLLTLYGRP